MRGVPAAQESCGCAVSLPCLTRAHACRHPACSGLDGGTGGPGAVLSLPVPGLYIWIAIGPKTANGAGLTMRMVVTEQLPPPPPPAPPPAPPSPPPPPPDTVGTWENPIDVGNVYDSGTVTYFKLQTPPATCGFLNASAPVLVHRYLAPAYMAGGTLVMDAQWPESVGDSVFSVFTSTSAIGALTCLG